MIPDIPKISIMVVTYNQESLVGRTLDSLIAQKNYIYEICVSDDCSPDGTWNVLLDYQQRYPELIKLHRQEKNVGIFENIEYSWSMPTGDLVFDLAGDDCVCENWFKTVVEFIQEHKIDYKKEKICIAGDFLNIYPNGDSFVVRNNYITKHVHPVRSYERGIVKPRSHVFSIDVLHSFEKVSQGRSYMVENAQDCQVYLFANHFYYLPVVGNIYYSGIGAGSRMNPEKMKEHEQTMVYAFHFLREHNFVFTKADNNLPRFNIAQKHARWYPGIKNYIRLVYWYLRSFDFPLSLYSINLRRLIFKICHRLPHKKAINW